MKALDSGLTRKIDFRGLPIILEEKGFSNIKQTIFNLQLFQTSLLIFTLCGFFISPSHARSLFELTVSTGSQTGTKEFSDIKSFVDQLSNNGLNQITSAYTPTSQSSAVLDLRGLQAFTSYGLNQTTLNFSVPSLGINENFTGVSKAPPGVALSRDFSKKEFFDFLKKDGGSILTRLLQGLVSQTPIDPVAGNPNSIMAKMSQDDYRLGSGLNAGGEYNLLGTGLMAGYSEASGFQTTFASVPINYIYTLPNPSKPPTLLILDVPLRYVNIAGGSVAEGSIGVGASFPVLNHWSLTPMFRYGVVASLDLGSIQSVYSGSVTSKYDLYYNDLKISLNNMIGYYETGSIISKYGGNYGLQNEIFRNGLSVEGALNYTLFDEPTSWELQFTDTRVTGDKWFIDGYEEITATVGTRRRQARMDWQTLRVGAGLTLGKNYQGGQLVFTYRF